PGRAILQDVEWGGITGFDDEGTSPLRGGESARFLILRVPRVVAFYNGGVRYDVNVPVEQRAAHAGGSIPVVNLDPSLPGYDVSAACLFPADDTTDALFDSTTPT